MCVLFFVFTYVSSSSVIFLLNVLSRCEFISCSSSVTVNNDFPSIDTLFRPPCLGSGYPGTAKYARVFEQSDFTSPSSFEIQCIKFGYVAVGKIDATFEIFIDANGGDPDEDWNMTSLGSFPTTVEYAGLAYSTGLVTLTANIAVNLTDSETLVVVMSHPLIDSPENFYPAGYDTSFNTGTDRTFVGGSCMTGYQSRSEYCNCNEGPNWFVELALPYSGGDEGGGSDLGDDICFHVESMIDYKGVEYTYEELKAGKESECTVPHSPFSKGVVITTSCDKTVRVTDTHLMATTKGFQLAYSLKAGDVLFGDYDKKMCIVQSVEKEKTTQQYFGLNCVHSEVLASGLRASTFGDFHTLPSWYMTYVGGLVGSETASLLGEYIAEWYFHH